MIERIVIKEAVTFDHAELRPENGLNIFSGPSGAGKSVLMGSILALFGLSDAQASLAEASLVAFKLPEDLPIEAGDELIVRQVKREKVRYFVNDSQIGRPALKALFADRVRHLNHKESSDISDASLLELLDRLCIQQNPPHTQDLAQFARDFAQYQSLSGELQALILKEQKAQELKELARFEIEKIDTLAPKEGEYERLMELKKRLSKKEKIAQLIDQVGLLREQESSVYELYDLLGLDKSLFGEAMGELGGALENGLSDMEELENTDPDSLLARIESLSSLIRRYGGIDEALAHAEAKRVELAGFESIEADIKTLKLRQKELLEQLKQLEQTLFQARQAACAPLQEAISSVLSELFMPSLTLELLQGDLDLQAGHRLMLTLSGTTLDRISSGEFNRLRLALLAARVRLGCASDRSVLLLDEIDANVSGEEAAAIARVLKLLASRYQIFAISHQSQLTSKADCHYLVTKEAGVSQVRALEREERVLEIARIISGAAITDAAMEHARKLLEE